MKTFKRIIASTVAALMILASLLTVNVFADAVAFTDVPADYYYKTAIDSLVANGVINGYTEEDGTSTFRPENTITRAEFAKLVAAATAKGVALTETTAQFPDVPADHWANTYIAYAVKAGIVNGYEDGTFRPSNPVTYGEAIKMLVCVKGYASVYTATNPWYDGWIQIANKISLTKNAMALGANPAPRGLVAQLVYNLDYCTQIQISNPSGGPSFGDSVTKKDSDYKETTGMLQAVFETTLTGEDLGLNKYEIMIDDVVYNISDSDVDGLTIDKFYEHLGEEIVVEYEQGASKRILKTYDPLNPKKVTIAAEDINDVEGYTIEYYASETATKVTEADLSSDLYVVYNGYGVKQSEIDKEFIEKYLFPDNGEITLMDSIGGKEYDVAWVTNYETYVVRSAPLSGEIFTITDKYFDKKLELNRKDCTFYRVSGTSPEKNKVESVSTIAPNTVLSVAQPYDRTEGTEVIMCSSKQTHEVEEMSGYDEVVINKKTYKASNYFMDLVEKDADTYGFTRGDYGDFYLDYTGKIVVYTESKSTDSYGYVLGFTKGNGLNGTCELLMYTSGSEASVYTFNDNVKVNGTNMKPTELGDVLKKNAARITENWSGMELENADYSQLVRYKADSKVLTSITTIDADNLENGGIVPVQIDTIGEDEDATKHYFSNGEPLMIKSSSGTNRTFVNESGQSQILINSSTKIFEVSKDRGNDKAVKTKSVGDFSSTSAKYVVEPYDIENGVAKVLLWYVGTASKVTVNTGNNVAFVVDVRGKNNEEGQTVQLLTYYYAGDSKLYKAYTEKETTVSDDIQAGDLIRLAKESKPVKEEGIEDYEVIGVQKVFVGGVLYDYNTSNVYDTFEATGNYIEKAHEKNGVKDTDYYNVIYGTVHTSDIGDGDSGTIQVVPTVDAYEETAVPQMYPFEIKSSTKIYKWDDTVGDGTLVQDVAKSDISAALVDNSFDCEDATKVVIVTIDNTIKCIYIIE